MQICDSRVETGGCEIFFRHNKLEVTRPTLLFIHGIGESGFCFLEVFHTLLADDFNILVPDLSGFGLSAAATDHNYSFACQVTHLLDLLDGLGIDQVHLVGHSMGGDIGTLFCHQHEDRVLSLVNIEGDLTADNRYVVDQALQADRDGRFEEWLRQEFTGEQITKLCHQWPSTVRYLASLQLCQSRAFLHSALEIDELLKPEAPGDMARIGSVYLKLTTPRVFCWGEQSLKDSAREFLDKSKLKHEAFSASYHWVMLDQPNLFYGFLAHYLKRQGP